MTEPLAQPASQPQPLATLLREVVDNDDELHRLRDEARRRRLPRVAAIQLPPSLCPADFTQASLASFGERTSAPQWRVGTIDPWAEWIAQNTRRRVAELLTALFDQLRDGGLVATVFRPPQAAVRACRLSCGRQRPSRSAPTRFWRAR